MLHLLRGFECNIPVIKRGLEAPHNEAKYCLALQLLIPRPEDMNVKKILCFGVLAGAILLGQEKSTDGTAEAAHPGYAITPTSVKVMGDLKYGQTSSAVNCSQNPRYTAFVFNGNSGDRVDITVKGQEGKALVTLADSSLVALGSGPDHIAVEIPDRGPDTEIFYIVFRDSGDKPARFTVQLKKLGGAPSDSPGIR